MNVEQLLYFLAATRSSRRGSVCPSVRPCIRASVRNAFLKYALQVRSQDAGGVNGTKDGQVGVKWGQMWGQVGFGKFSSGVYWKILHCHIIFLIWVVRYLKSKWSFPLGGFKIYSPSVIQFWKAF